MKKLSWALIILGILIIAYPTVDKLYSLYEQNKYLKEVETNISGNSDTVQGYEALDEVFNSGDSAEETTSTNTPSVSNKPTSTPTPKKEYKATGILKINKIKLNLPIFYGTSTGILKIGAGQIKGTSELGQIGNTVLASHRSHTYGRLFNRINELENGDEILVVVNDKTYKYKVYNKIIVLPDDVSVLNRNKKDKRLTLVTCDPMINPTHRLIIQAISE